jgi:hypothetical protein
MNSCVRCSLAVSLLALTGIALRPAPTAASSEAYAPDIAFVRAAVRGCLEEKLSGIPLEPGDTVAVVATADEKRNWLVEDVLVGLALDRGLHVILPREAGQSAPRPGYALRFRLADLALNCFPERKGLLGRAVTTRRLRFDVFLSLADRNGHIVWTSWATAARAEAIPSQHDVRLESSDFLSRNVIESESKLTEIVVVGGVVGSLLYLLL